MTFFQLNQRDWDTLKVELGKSFDVERNYNYKSPEKSKKSKLRMWITADNRRLLVKENKMGEQMIVDRTVDRYQRLDEILRSKMLKDEHAAFLQGRKFELMLLIYNLDEQAIVRLTESSTDAKPEMVGLNSLREVNPN